ncbi:MAG: LD-carboxypeptidase [Bacteroidales bacterium]|nr:LD-carboxypeptidase [Bacteroidales bacterium]
MTTPPWLKTGDKVGLVAPASYVKAEELARFLAILDSWGLKAKLGKNLYRRKNSFAGNDDQRAADFQQMLDDPSVKAVLCARGGYGTIRIIDRLNFSGFSRNPKWIIGCSDITVMHTLIQKTLNTESLHAIMPRHITEGKKDLSSLESLKNALFGNLNSYVIKPVKNNRQGEASGILVGGNLSVLYSMRGTKLDIDTSGKILFIEDVGEYLYHIDRMIMNLKTGGKLKNLSGLIVGGMTGMKVSVSGFRKTANDVIYDAVEEYHFPVMFGFPAGHIRPNMALIMGREVTMHVEEKECKLIFRLIR